MTGYFDSMGVKLGKLITRANAGERVEDDLDAWEEEIIKDCTIAVSLPATSDTLAVPEDLARAVHRTILKYAVRCQPVNAPPADFEEPWEHHQRLQYLNGDLHTAFHEIAKWSYGLMDAKGDRWGPPHIPFSDDPRTPVRHLYALGEAVRETMVPKVEFLVHYVFPGREALPGLTSKLDKPQVVKAETVYIAARKIGESWAGGQAHTIRFFRRPDIDSVFKERQTDAPWEYRAWEDIRVTRDAEFGDVSLAPLTRHELCTSPPHEPDESHRLAEDRRQVRRDPPQGDPELPA